MRYRLLGLLCSILLATPLAAREHREVPVKVERVKPKKEKLSTLRFLKENRDFLRGQMDVLQQVSVDLGGHSDTLDERFLMFQEMLSELAAARDTVSDEHLEYRRREFLASVNELGELDARLDLLETLLSRQERRLWRLHQDFLGRQETALVVVVRGRGPEGPDAVSLVDGYGETTRIEFSEAQRRSLGQGGIAQIYHGFVEPREQSWEVSLDGESWRGSETVFLTLEPERNRLTLLELDLSRVDGHDAVSDLTATAWIHEPSAPPTRADRTAGR